MSSKIDSVNRAAADALVRRVLEHVLEDGLSWREAAAYQIGKTRGIELDRLDKVVALARDAFLKRDDAEREVEPGRWRSSVDDAPLEPDWPDRVAEAAYGALEAADNGDELAAAIDQERPVTFFYRRPVPRAERLHKQDVEHAGWKHVSPYEIRESLKAGGEEYLVGFDHDIEAIRNFRLSRIEGRVVSDPSIDYRPAINELGGVA